MIPFIIILAAQSHYSNYIGLHSVSSLEFKTNFNVSKGELRLEYRHTPVQFLKDYPETYAPKRLNHLFQHHAPKSAVCQNMGQNDQHQFVWKCQDINKNKYMRWDYDEVNCLYHSDTQEKIQIGSCQLTRYVVLEYPGHDYLHKLQNSQSIGLLLGFLLTFIGAITFGLIML